MPCRLSKMCLQVEGIAIQPPPVPVSPWLAIATSCCRSRLSDLLKQIICRIQRILCFLIQTERVDPITHQVG